MINRVEVIDHREHLNTEPEYTGGRVFTIGPDDKALVEMQMQDEGRTLKVFVRSKSNA